MVFFYFSCQGTRVMLGDMEMLGALFAGMSCCKRGFSRQNIIQGVACLRGLFCRDPLRPPDGF